MKSIFPALLTVIISSVGLVSLAANATCPSTEDKMSCTVTFKNASGNIANQTVNFSVFSSTYLCNGKPNKFYTSDFKLNPDYTAVVFADWDSLRLSFYESSDTAKVFPLSDFHSARAAGDETNSMQSNYVSLPNQQYAQIMCSTVVRGN